MKRRYYKRKKTAPTYKILITIIIILSTLSIGYSLLNNQLNILGSISLNKEKEDIIDKLPSNSIATWEISDTPWNGKDGEQYYRIDVKLKNQDQDYDEWKIQMAFPPYVIENKINAWGSNGTKVEHTEKYDIVTFNSYNWNGNIKKDDTLTMSFIIPFTKDLTLNINNLIFNDRLVKDFKQIGKKYETENNDIPDNPNTPDKPDNPNPTDPDPGNTEEPEKEETTSNNTVNWRIESSWPSNQKQRYQINIEVLNLDEDISSWNLELDFGNKIVKDSVSQWISPTTKVIEENNSTKIYLSNYSYNGEIKKGSSININMQLTIEENEELNLQSIKLNNKATDKITKQTKK